LRLLRRRIFFCSGGIFLGAALPFLARASFALLLAARLAENPIILLFRISPAPTLPELINIKAEQ